MERVFSLETAVVFAALSPGRLKPPSGPKTGQILKRLGHGEFLAAVEGGDSVRVRGPETLRVGSKVQVVLPESGVEKRKPRPEGLGPAKVAEDDFQWFARLPLGFGGKGAEARIEVFVEKQTKGPLLKAPPVSYLVFTVQTEKQGEIQWSIYLKGLQVAFQVYAAPDGMPKESLKALARGIEESLEKKGFVLIAPTLFLNRPFKVPAGFRLNVKG